MDFVGDILSHILFIDNTLELSDKLFTQLKSEGIVIKEIDPSDSYFENQKETKENMLRSGGISMDRSSRCVLSSDIAVDLTASEYNILEMLLTNTGKVVSKERLSENALGRKMLHYDRSLDMHISKLRQKLFASMTQTNVIKTIRGIGYQLIELPVS